MPHPSDEIEFVDPTTGYTYKVKPTLAAVDAAYDLGMMPRTEEDLDSVEAVDQIGPVTKSSNPKVFEDLEESGEVGD